MGIVNNTCRALLMIVGILVVCIDYFIVMVISTVGTWGATVLSAPELGVGLTLLLCIPLFGILVLVAVIGIWLFARGLVGGGL